MSTAPSGDERPVLSVGATGDLGSRTVRALRARGLRVRALVRPGSDVRRLPTEGIEVVAGDLLDPPSLARAVQGVRAVVSTAIGYSRRRKGDSLRTDTEGNRNLVLAAKDAGVPRFVFLSILACDQAPDVPHFWAKKLTEDALQQAGVPFVALRPGAFLASPQGRFREWMLRNFAKGRVMAMTPAGIRITYIAPEEVARALAMAVDEPRAVGERIDLGSDRPLSGPELAGMLSGLLGRRIEPRAMFGPGAPFAMKLLAAFNPGMRDMMAMGRFFQTGKYVANTSRQAELFGPVPRVEDAARQMLTDLGLLPRTAPG